MFIEILAEIAFTMLPLDDRRSVLGLLKSELFLVRLCCSMQRRGAIRRY